VSIEKFSVNGYRVMPFAPIEVEQYKAIRMEALQMEPGMFSSTYAREIMFTEEQWLNRLNNITNACFGLYYHEEVVGVTGIVVNDPNESVATMTQSYIRVAHREKGLSRLLYEARIDWAKKKGIKKLLIGHREGNVASRSANQHYGFSYTHRESLQWPDGSVADSVFYELDIE
jgi:GNAT superfamily N-acetyltransferase